jgi:hypothetical protein
MLDKRSIKFLNNILVICGDGSYKIIETNDLIKGMLPRYKVDAEAISQITKFLVGNEMIDIKYNDENVYCMAVLPKARVYIESKSYQKKDTSTARLLIVAGMLGSFLAAFLGTLLANIIMG